MFQQNAPEPPVPTVNLLRVGPGGSIKTLAIGDPTCVYTHFYRGRTYPCPQGDCPLCREDYVARFYSYTPCIFQDVTRLLELTQAATYELSQSCPEPLRGKIINAYRAGKRQNAPLHASVTGDYENGKPLPPIPDVRAVLFKIWRLGHDVEGKNDHEYAEHVRQVLAKLTENSR